MITVRETGNNFTSIMSERKKEKRINISNDNQENNNVFRQPMAGGQLINTCFSKYQEKSIVNT